MYLVSDVPRPGRRLRVNGCVRQIYTLDGLRGFYRGLTASYAGVCVCVCVGGRGVYLKGLFKQVHGEGVTI